MNKKHLAQHLLVTLLSAQMAGRRLTLGELVREVRVRKGDVRATLTLLHRQGLYDALHGRLTLLGFAVARSVDPSALPELRPQKSAKIVAA